MAVTARQELNLAKLLKLSTKHLKSFSRYMMTDKYNTQ